MKGLEIINLSDPTYERDNRVVRSPPYRTPPEIIRSSPHYSDQVNINYRRIAEAGHHVPDKRERLHFHKSPIEKYYIVLEGKLSVLMDGEECELGPLQLLKVPPNTRHKRTDYFGPLAYIVIRAPKSTEATKIYCE